MATIDSNTGGSYYGSDGLYADSGGRIAAGQSFTGNGYKITSISIMSGKTGSQRAKQFTITFCRTTE